MLFNIDTDPAETKNLAKEYPQRTQQLLEALKNWETTLARPRWYDGSNWKHWQNESVKNHRMHQDG